MKKSKLKNVIALACACCLCLLLSATAIWSDGRADEPTVVEPKSLWSEVDTNLATIEQNVPSPDFVTVGILTRWVIYTEENPAPMPDYVKSGVKVTVPTNGVSVEYQNIIDLNTLDNGKPLLDWMPLANERGTASMSRFTVRLEDVYDESNYIDVVFWQGYYRMFWNVDFDGREAKHELMYEFGDFSNQPTWHYDKEHSLVSPYSLRYDRSSGAFSVYRYYEDGVALKNSLNPTSFDDFGTKTFKGFTDNLVKMTLTVNAINEECSYYIYNVAGQGMNGATISDTQAPSFHIDKPAEIPKAYVGKSYNLFDAQAYDVIDGKIDHEIRLFEPNAYKTDYDSDDYVVVTDSFTPTAPGKYVALYYAEDAAGNATSIEVNIRSAHIWDELEIATEPLVGTAPGEDDVYEAGNPIAVPKYKVVGGSGEYTTSVKAYSILDNAEIEIKNGYAVTTKAGNYKFVITAIDYVGNRVTKNVYFDVKSSRVPVLRGTPNMFKQFYDGKAVELPTVEAYDYNSYPGVPLGADFKVIAISESNVETEIYNSANGQSRIAFLPSKTVYGNEITIKYVYKCKKGSWDEPDDCLIKEFVVPVLDAPQYYYDYYYADDGTTRGGNTNDEYKNANRYVSFKSDGTASTFGFVNPVAANDASVEMTFPASGQAFSGFTVRFVDAFNSEVGFETTIYKISGTYVNNSTLKYGGYEYRIPGGFDLADGNYGTAGKTPIKLAYDDGKLYAYGNTFVCNVDKDFNGEPFDGFPSGAVRLEFKFGSPQENAQVNISNIAGQAMQIKYKNGVPEIVKDNAKPKINVLYDEAQYSLGDIIDIPYAYAVDTLSSAKVNADGEAEVVRVYVEVFDPSRQAILSKRELTRNLSFSIGEYGNYEIKYSATDAGNNSATYSVIVKAEDVTAPIITLSDSRKSFTAKVGEKTWIPAAVVLDNVTPYEYIKLSCTVIKPNGKIVSVAKAEVESNDRYSSYFAYVPDTAGTHKITYLAIDEAGNIAMKYVTMIVSEV